MFSVMSSQRAAASVLLIRSIVFRDSARVVQNYSTSILTGETANKDSVLMKKEGTGTNKPYNWNLKGRKGTKKKAVGKLEDIRAPKDSISEFELKVYKAHFLSIHAIGTRMKLSGLFMQATCGPNKTPEPPRDYPIEHAHWIAWKSHGDMTREEAEKEYIDTVKMLIKKSQLQPTDFNTYGQ